MLVNSGPRLRSVSFEDVPSAEASAIVKRRDCMMATALVVVVFMIGLTVFRLR